MDGGSGDDIYFVRNPRTVISERTNAGTDTVYVYVNGWVPPANVERVIYMNGAVPPADPVLALHETRLRVEPGSVTVLRYFFVEAPFDLFKSSFELMFKGDNLPAGQSLQMATLDQNFRNAFRQAADELERVANVRFIEVTNLADTDIAVGSHNMTVGGYASLGTIPGETSDSSAGFVVSISEMMISSSVQTSNLLKGGSWFSVMVHELGHIAGLKHPFEGTFRLGGDEAQNGRYTLMSYGSGKSNDGLMIYDIEAVRAIFGANPVATGNDVYRFDQATRFFPGLVDDGGIDTIDLSGNANAATLDLRPGAFSTVNVTAINQPNFARNLGIANGTVIENAVGTALADRITGNDANNQIEGGAGDDQLDGGAGADVASYLRAAAAVTVNLGITTAQNTGGAGTDTLINFEHLLGSIFNDTLIGDAGPNMLVGGPGSDLLDGAAGFDTAVYTALRAAISFTRNADGSVTIFAGAEGNDRLTGIEQLRFGEALFAIARFDQPGGVRMANFTPGAGGWSNQDRFLRQMADVNGDGFADIVGFGQAGVLVSLGSAAGNFAQPNLAVADFGVAQGWLSANSFHRELADVNGDGRADIVGFGVAGVLVSLARADGTFAVPLLGSSNFNPANGWETQDGSARTLADVNGDGFADIIGFGTAGTLAALGDGRGGFGTATLIIGDFGVNQGWSSANSFHRTVADVNGDGRGDLVGFGTAGTLVALAQTNGSFANPFLALANFGTSQGWSSQDAFTRDLADVNGDGYDDIVGFGIPGTFVAYGQPDGRFSAAAYDLANFGSDQGWTSDNIFHRELADVNGDGRADIVGFGQSGVFAAIAFDGLVI